MNPRTLGKETLETGDQEGTGRETVGDRAKAGGGGSEGDLRFRVNRLHD